MKVHSIIRYMVLNKALFKIIEALYDFYQIFFSLPAFPSNTHFTLGRSTGLPYQRMKEPINLPFTESQLHDRIISLRGVFWAHTTS